MKYETVLHDINRSPVSGDKAKRPVITTLRLFITRAIMIVMFVVLLTSPAAKAVFQRISENHHINSFSEINRQFRQTFGLK